MRTIALTLHPAIDRVAEVATLRPGATLDSQLKLTVPAGKGVNTSRVLARLIAERGAVLSVAWVGAEEAPWFKRRLDAEGIESAFCTRDCNTRVTCTFLEKSGRETHVKESMPEPSASEERELLRIWPMIMRRGDNIAVCGSAPGGTTEATLHRLFEISRDRAAVAIADTNGAALRAAGSAGLAGIKGNALEMGQWLGLRGALDFKTSAHLKKLNASFRKTGAPKMILITRGAAGAVLATRDETLFAAAPRLPVGIKAVSATGCGDAATAGWLWAIRENCSHAEMLNRAVACGTAKLANADPGTLDAALVRKLLRGVEARSSR